MNAFQSELHIELVADRCAGAAECDQVWPRDVLKVNGRQHKVVINKPDQCV